MSNLIFFKTRFNHEGGYRSYTDFWRLVDLAGYRTCLIDEIDTSSDNVYIGTPFDNVNHPLDSAIWTNGWPDARARIILWDLEWHMGDNALPYIPGLAEVWASDAWYAQQIGACYVPLGSDARLPLTPIQRNGQYDYDVATLSYNGPWRRQEALGELTKYGLRLAPNAWDVERDRILERSRVMLHIHQHDYAPTVAPLRWAIAAAYRMPLITEPLADSGIFSPILKFIFEHRRIGELTAQTLRTESSLALEDYGYRLHHFLCELYKFRDCIEAAL